MVIGIDASRAFVPEPTGIHRYATEVCRGLMATPPADLRLYWPGARPPAGAPPVLAGSTWRCLPLPRGWTAIRLRLELARRPPSLLFVPAYRLPPGRVPPSVVTIHGVEHRLTPESYTPGERRRLERFVRDTLARARAVVTPSETTKADLVHLYGADPGRVHVIVHGADRAATPPPPPEAARLRGRWLGTDPGPYLLTVGGHSTRKNLPFLIAAVAAARAAGCPAALVCTGVPEAQRALLRTAAQAAGIGDACHLLPYLPPADLEAFYAGALGVAVASRYEGFGLPALDAMARGVPVVGSGVGGVQELAAGAALLPPPDDLDAWRTALCRLAAEPDLRQHLAALGRRRAAPYTWEASVAAHAALLGRELARTAGQATRDRGQPPARAAERPRRER